MERLYDASELTDEQRKHLESLESEIEQAQQKLLAETPDHIIALGDVLRRSITANDLGEFKDFLTKYHIEIPDGTYSLRVFRDLLIVNRVDTKDLEPEARARLRAKTLSSQDQEKASKDYRLAVSESGQPFCRDCKWFVTAPNDGEDNASKSCVDMGTKGADVACYGFTAPSK